VKPLAVAFMLLCSIACYPIFDTGAVETSATTSPADADTDADSDADADADSDADSDADADADADSDTDTDTDTEPAVQDITGEWVSSGSGIAPLFAEDPFSWVLVEASFSSGGAYAAHAVDGAGTSFDFAGTYTVDTSTVPGTIEIAQTAPYAAVAVGIWQVDGGVLTYEVAQTIPDYGFGPPTPESGFGSTTGDGLTPGALTQTYVRP
jgi:hypothetical protein